MKRMILPFCMIMTMLFACTNNSTQADGKNTGTSSGQDTTSKIKQQTDTKADTLQTSDKKGEKEEAEEKEEED